ncbi:MAG: CapA family protein [Chloroflexi bacterium]|nr:CapA family protein [Chloroflexota bacterium]
MNNDSLLLYAAGDVVPNRQDPESLVELVAPTIRKADMAFCQLETSLSDRHTVQVHRYSARPFRSSPHNVRALTFAGFNVVSAAGNHILDNGEEALFDTMEVLRSNNIAVAGIGANIQEARKPAIIERKGTSLAFLAYNCLRQYGYEADVDKPGSNAIWVDTFYKQVDPTPGCPPKIITIPHAQDVEAMEADIRAAKSLADLVVVSMHWGVHFIPRLIAMYQKQLGHAAIDAGADIILGHHSHIIGGIEVYKGKAIFYSLGNFAFDHKHSTYTQREHKERAEVGWAHLKRLSEDEYPTYALPFMSTRSMLARCIIAQKRISKVSFLPVLINKTGQPEILAPGSEISREIFASAQGACDELGTRLSWEGGEIVVQTSAD